MKKLILAAALSVMSINAYSENSTYSEETRILKIPIVEFNGGPAYSGVEFMAREDGLFELVNLEYYTDIPSFQLKDAGTHSNQKSQYTISKIGGIHKTSVEGRSLTLVVTGLYGGSVERYSYQSNGRYSFELDFALTPSNFPDPNNGVKGKYYTTSGNGNIAYADLL